MEYTTGTKVFNGYKIVRELGEGSFGNVYEIEKNDYGLQVKSALKVIRIPRSKSEIRSVLSEGMNEDSVTTYFQGVVDEIVREIAVMSTLKGHSNIVSCEDYQVLERTSEIGWDILIRMELLTPLTDYQHIHPLTEADVRRLGEDICSALAFCEKKGLVHRDIKPENIFVNEDGRFMLGDFGVARSVEKTLGGLSKKGTEGYMAPEIYLGKPYGVTVDVYSLGLVLYRFANGNRLPFFPLVTETVTFSFSSREQALMKRMQGEPLPQPACGDAVLSDVILKACAYEPSERYQTAAEMLEALRGSVSAPSDDPKIEGTKKEEESQNREEEKVHAVPENRNPEVPEQDVNRPVQTEEADNRTVENQNQDKEEDSGEATKSDENKNSGNGKALLTRSSAVLLIFILALIVFKNWDGASGTIVFGNNYETVAKKENHYYGNGSLATSYEYDEAGNEVKWSSYNSDGSLAYSYEYEYDEAGNQVKESRYNGDGSLAYSCEYDEAGNLVKKSYYRRDGSLFYIDEYDEAGNQVKESRYNGDGSLDYSNEY